MNFLTLANSRYTVKKFEENKKVSANNIQQLKEILRLSPSSINSQPWQFVFISDEKVKCELAAVSYFNEQRINEASHLVVFRAIDNIEKFEEQIHENLPEGNIGYYNNFLKPLSEKEIKSWLQHQVYLSLGFFLSASASLGIDSTPMEGIQNEEYDRILQLDGYTSLFAVALGHRSEDDRNQPSHTPKSRLPLEQVVQSI